MHKYVDLEIILGIIIMEIYYKINVVMINRNN